MLFQTWTKNLYVIGFGTTWRWINDDRSMLPQRKHMLCTISQIICLDGLPVQAERKTHNKTHVAFRAHTIKTCILFSAHTRMWPFPIATCKRLIIEYQKQDFSIHRDVCFLETFNWILNCDASSWRAKKRVKKRNVGMKWRENRHGSNEKGNCVVR